MKSRLTYHDPCFLLISTLPRPDTNCLTADLLAYLPLWPTLLRPGERRRTILLRLTKAPHWSYAFTYLTHPNSIPLPGETFTAHLELPTASSETSSPQLLNKPQLSHRDTEQYGATEQVSPTVEGDSPTEHGLLIGSNNVCPPLVVGMGIDCLDNINQIRSDKIMRSHFL